MSFYHSPDQIDQMKSTKDTYDNPQPSNRQLVFKVAKPAGKIIIGEWFSNHYPIYAGDSGWWCWSGRRNYLFADGSVLLIKAVDIRPANDNLPDINLTINGIRGIDWPR